MSAPLSVLTVGAAAMRLRLPYTLLPEENGYAITDTPPRITYGGAGTEQALALSALGARSLLCCCVGDDNTGYQLRRYLERCRVDIRFVYETPNSATSVMTSLVKSGEEPRVLLYSGNAGAPSSEQLQDAFLSLPDVVCLRGEMPFRTTLTAAALAAREQIPIFLDASSIRGDFDAVALPALEVLSLSDTAAEALTGICPGGTDSCVKAALALSAKIKAKYYVFRLGARGCFLYDGKIPYHISPCRTKATDFSFAGDVFAAALVMAYADGDQNIRSACEYANAAMALYAETAHPSIYPTHDEIQNYRLSGAV
ncbi:MAG: hypothetical protein J6R42_05790 [Clostridia bacterium]|nr:hypothetical protein [Clostridia bacterium]